MAQVKRCSKCQALIVHQTWELTVTSVEASSPVRLEFCTHLCLFEWLREVHGDEMTGLTFFRKGAGGVRE